MLARFSRHLTRGKSPIDVRRTVEIMFLYGLLLCLSVNASTLISTLISTHTSLQTVAAKPLTNNFSHRSFGSKLAKSDINAVNVYLVSTLEPTENTADRESVPAETRSPLAAPTDLTTNGLSPEAGLSLPPTASSVSSSATSGRTDFSKPEPSSPAFEKWPAAKKLQADMQELRSQAATSLSSPFELMISNPIESSPSVRIVEWTNAVMRTLDSLQQQNYPAANPSTSDLERLQTLASLGSLQGEQVQNSELRTLWLCAAYSVQRRACVWKAAFAAAQPRIVNTTNTSQGASETFEQVLSRIAPLLDATGDSERWSEYLLLDDLAKLARTETTTTKIDQERNQVAQRFLSRMKWHRLTKIQQQWLDQPEFAAMSNFVRPWAAGSTNYGELLNQIESQESEFSNATSLKIARSIQNLKHSDHPEDQHLAHAIDSHYRNANLRIAMSDHLINRLLPQTEPKSVPLRTRTMGTLIQGTSDVKSSIGIQLVPSQNQWSVLLKSIGDVTTLSTGQQSVVELHTRGTARFESGTPVSIHRQGIKLNETNVDVAGRLQLRGVKSDLDDYPILGGFVRTIAEKRFQTLRPKANQIANQTLRRQIRSEIDNTLESQTTQASEKLEDLVVQPLEQMELDPTVTELRTTQEQLLGRFRIAGDWQMAAFTPRPRAPNNSLLSIQLHQSAINNTLEQLLPSGETMPIDQVLKKIAASFGQTDFQTPPDMPNDVEVRFASTRPVFVEIDEESLNLTLRIVQLKRGRAVDLRNVIITASYKPEVKGLHAYLIRDGHLSINGPNMSMRKRFPARTIFNKVLSTNHSLPITLKGLENRPVLAGLSITHLELTRGWIGLAISDEESPRLAVAP